MLVPRAMQLANELSKKNQAALRLGKRLINSHLRKDMDGVLDIENKTADEAFVSDFPLRNFDLSMCFRQPFFVNGVFFFEIHLKYN